MTDSDRRSQAGPARARTTLPRRHPDDAAPGSAATEERQHRARKVPEPAKAHSPFTFLGQAARLLAGSLDYETTLATVAGLALPELGVWCIVDVVEPDGSIRRLAIVHPDPDKQRLARKLQENWPPRRDDRVGTPVILGSRETQVVSEVSDEMLTEAARGEGNLAILRELGIGSLLVVPLIARGEVRGAITYVTARTGQRYTEQNLALAENLAALSALAIDNARNYREAQQARGDAERAAKEAKRQQKDLEVLMESHNRLMRGFSHDVKNPLGAAEGYAQLLEMEVSDSLTPEQLESVGRIRASIRSALDLIDNLIGYATGALGKTAIRWEATDVGEIVREIAEEYRAQIEAAALAIEVEVPEQLPVIQSDRLRIRQILGNLLSNVVKYIDAGGVTLRAGLRSGGDAPGPGEWVAVEVEDTGPGIPEEKQHLLFHEFARLEPGSAKGTGLGLAIGRQLAEALGGELTLESEEARGATFTIWLPLAPKQNIRTVPSRFPETG